MNTEMLSNTTIPTDATRVPLRPLALGEKTGHHHSLAVEEPKAIEDCVEMYEKDGVLYVRVTEDGVALTHQEHKTHAVPVGDYQLVTQQENTDMGSRAVLD